MKFSLFCAGIPTQNQGVINGYPFNQINRVHSYHSILVLCTQVYRRDEFEWHPLWLMFEIELWFISFSMEPSKYFLLMIDPNFCLNLFLLLWLQYDKHIIDQEWINPCRKHSVKKFYFDPKCQCYFESILQMIICMSILLW